MSQIELTRRQLLKTLGGGILVLVSCPSLLAQRGESGGRGGGQIPQTIDAWLHVGPDGKITVLTGKVEVGQNARTSVTQAAAEELRVPMEMVTVVMGDTDLVPYDQGTFGSRTTPTMIPQIRRAAAAAREALADLAAVRFGVDKATLKFEDGRVTSGNFSAGYGELAKDQPLNKPIGEVALTLTSDWKTLGKPVPKVSGRDIVTGRHQYASDLHRDGLLYGKVLRPPTFGTTIVSLDGTEAEKMPGVKVVRDGEFACVAAPTLRRAEEALSILKCEWKESDQPAASDLEKILRSGATPPVEPTGDKTIKATYSCAYIAHVPLEPRAALAEWDGKKMTVHTGSQRPFGVKTEVAQALGVPEEQVRVIVPDTGAGLGGKHTGDAAIEAARMAKALGKPVKVTWTREEELTFAYFRPAGIVDLTAGAAKDGSLVHWTFDNYNSGGSALETPYEIPGAKQQFHRAESPLRQGSYRGLAATFNNFARECAMDELALLLGMDPLAFRLKNLKSDRLKAVLQAVADKIDFNLKERPEGHGVGLSCGTEKGAFVANAVEVLVKDKEVRVLRAVTAFECGTILNPTLLQQQVEGSVVMGIGGALFEEVKFDKGKIQSNLLSRYRVPRFSDVPKMETILIDRKDLPSAGAGETPIMAIAPAIGNAIHNAVGLRLRSMPMRIP